MERVFSSVRVPEIGDKLANIHSESDIKTVFAVVEREDYFEWFTKEQVDMWAKARGSGYASGKGYGYEWFFVENKEHNMEDIVETKKLIELLEQYSKEITVESNAATTVKEVAIVLGKCWALNRVIAIISTLIENM